MSARPLTALVFSLVPMAAEALRSHRHERTLRAAGAMEPPDDVYGLMAVAYPCAFVLMAAEGAWRAQSPDGWFLGGLLVWTLSKALKYAAMRALAERWSFRVLVIPGAPLVTHGPYRVMRHPNYVAVVGELLAAALMCPAPVTGAIAMFGFGPLVLRRIGVEERALGLRRSVPASPARKPREDGGRLTNRFS